MASKERLDVLLVEKGIYESRSQAKRAIMAGKILVNGEIIDKAGTSVKNDVEIKIKGEILPFVSRGGLKLEKALKVFDIDPEGKEAIDIGASTGGFTDCLLQNGASRVYAVDVGYGQLAWKLRQDERVEVMERTNFRYLSTEELPVKVPLIVTDVSFISLRLIIPPAIHFLEDNGDILALIKPQFEAGPERIGKNGVVREKKIHVDILMEMIEFFINTNLTIKGLDYSPITGASSKNIEFLIHLKYKEKIQDEAKSNQLSVQNIKDNWYKTVYDLINEAHYILEGG
ncbi:MAG: TlyA family RNA methyltransferase [Halanaerobiales bacterium]